MGQGPPAHGGIPSFIATLLSDPVLQDRVPMSFLNTTHDPGQPGAATRANVGWLVRDVGGVIAGARRARIVHLNLAPAPLLPLVRACVLAGAARIAGAKVIVHAHSGRLHSEASSSAAFRAALRLLVLIAHRMIVVSRDGAGAIRRARGNPILLVNAVNTDDFVSVCPPETRIVAFVGTVCERKGLDDLRRALLMLRDAKDQAPVPSEVVIVGDGRQEGPGAFDRVRDAYAASGLLDLVRFAGALPPQGVRTELAKASVFCLPSHWEGLPISMLEAMAAGCAVVATRLGEIPAVLDGSGIVVDAHDPKALASAIGDLMVDTDRRVRLGVAARERVRARYSLDSMQEGMLAIYADLGYSR